jgi:hypothetical protein
MAYIVEAEESEDHSAVSKTHEDRKDALVTAVKWGSEGRNGRAKPGSRRRVFYVNRT